MTQQRFPLGRRLLWGVCAVAVLIIGGSIGYMLIEGWSFFTALYMTMETLTTVGYGDIHPTSDASRLFSMILFICGLGAVAYLVVTGVQYLLQEPFKSTFWRRRMRDKISKLKDHFIVCGYGRVGQETVRIFKNAEVPFVVIDHDEQAIAKAAEDGILCFVGNATSDDTLRQANIQQARGLIAAVGDDADNIYITLSARGLNSSLIIVARASTEDTVPKLKRAGANRVIMPFAIGGLRMAMAALRPVVVDFLDTVMHTRDRDLILEQIQVGQGSPLAGTTISGGRCPDGATVLAVKKRDGTLITNPVGDTLLELDDELVVIGTREQLRALESTA